MTPLRLAHRGDWRVAPENSLEAMRAALAIPGCDGLEFDVRTSRDGQPVLLHDPTLKRVQGVVAAVDTLDAVELVRHGIPTLAEVLAAAGPEAFCDIELKAMPTERLLEVIEAARGGAGSGSLRRAAVSSFDAAFLRWVAGRRPGWTTWLNAMDVGAVTLSRARDLGCSAIAAAWESIDRRGVERATDAGVEVVAWTVRRRPTYARLARLGAIAICVESGALDG